MTEELKAEYAAHQLQGPTGIWWSHHRTTYPEGTPITWNRFTTAFRGNYIPPGVVEMKVGEFMRLSQGTKYVKEYLHAFNNLARYALEFVNTEAKKIAFGYFKRKQKNPQAHGYRCSLHPGVFQSIDFPRRT